MSEFLSPLLDWLAQHSYWLGGGIFLIALLECLPPIGILWPGAVLMFSAALLAGQGDMPLWPLVMLAWFGAMTSHSLAYLLGIRLQSGTRNLRLLRSRPDWLLRAEVHLARYGVASLFLGHFIGPVRPVLSLLAGMLRMPAPTFFLTSLFASGAWALTAILPGWLAGAALDNTPPEGFWWQTTLIAGGCLLLAGNALWLHKKRPKWGQFWLAGLSAILLLALLTGWPHLSAFDLYLQQQVLLLSAPALDVIMLVATLLGEVKLQLVFAGILCFLLLWQRAYAALLFTTLTLTSANGLNLLLKKAIMRPRPDLLPHALDGYSMPSGHSLRSFAFCMIIAILLCASRREQLRPILLILVCIPAALTGFSRIYLTAHWPSDVLASMLLATCCCALALAVTGSNRLAGTFANPRCWQLQGGLSLLAALLFIAWSFTATASRYNLLQGMPA